MIYKSALDSITCILTSCDPEIQKKLMDTLQKNRPSYVSEWNKKHGIPSELEFRRNILNGQYRRKKTSVTQDAESGVSVISSKLKN